MCSRYPTPHDYELLLTQFEIGDLPGYRPQTNVAPTDSAPVIIARDSKREVHYMRWGLLPHWAKDDKGAAKLINARVETVFEKPSFSQYVKRSRCIVPAAGFFEWNPIKDPYLIRLKNGALMGIAGIWNRWHDPVEPKRVIETYSVITSDANSLVANVHDRMPALIRKERYSDWLSKDIQEAEEVAPMMYFVNADEVELIAQDRALNSSKRKDIPLKL